MKRLMILSALVISSLVHNAADAQVRINVNIGNQPEWGPYGYNSAAYYYLPDVDAYYNVPNRTFTYFQGNRWITRNALPGRYKNYDLYRGYKVVINDRDPWLRHSDYRTRYAGYRGRYDQQNIRDYRSQAYARDNYRNNYRNDRDNGRGTDDRDRRNDNNDNRWNGRGDDRRNNRGDDSQQQGQRPSRPGRGA